MRTKVLISTGLGLVALVCIGLPAEAQDGEQVRYEVAGKLEGKVLYTGGHHGKVTVTLEATSDPRVFTGNYTLTLLTEDAPEVQRGTVRATVEGDTLRATFGAHKATGKLGSAGSHATYAVYGSFADPGGVFMLYRYGS